MGLTQTIVGAPAAVSNITLDLAQDAAEGIYGVGDGVPYQSEANAKFSDSFNEIHGKIPDGNAAWVYDAINVLAMAIEKSGSTEPAKIREGILSIQGYEGAEGVYDFEEDGDGLHGYTLVQIKDGKQEILKQVSFQKGE